MTSKSGWFAILDARALVIPDVLATAARFAPTDARPEDGFQIVTGDIASVALGEAYGHADPWAQAVSKVARRTVISFFVLDQWSYQVCRHGAVIGGMEGYPLEVPELFGDIKEAARLIGTTPDVLERYCRGAGDEDAGRFAGDRHAPSDDRAHVDFARRLGIPDPWSKRARTIAAPPTAKRRSWKGLDPGPMRPSVRPEHKPRVERAPRGVRNPYEFAILVRVVDGMTRLSVPADPSLAEAHADDDVALGRLEARALRQIAAHVERDRYPHDTLRFTYALNRDWESRDRLVFGKPIKWAGVPTGLLPFSGLAASTLAELIQAGFCDPDPEPDPQRLARFVRPCDWLTVLRRHPGSSARGIAVSPRRPDYRIEIEGLEGPAAAKAAREAKALSRAALRAATGEVGVDISAPSVPGKRSAIAAAKASAVRALADALEAGRTSPVDYVRLGQVRES